jgi:hypothetical protein
MKYQYNDKFDIKGADFSCEILGVFPGGQQRTLQIKGTSYKILLNGIEMDISENNLDLLRNAGAKEVPAEEIIEPLKKVVMEKVYAPAILAQAEAMIPKKKPGRPAKK